MSTITILVGNIFFPRLVMANRVKELHKRMNWLAMAFALILVGGVAGTLLFVYHHPVKPPTLVKSFGQ